MYCFSPSSENLYLVLTTLYSCCHTSVYVGTALMMVSLTRTPTHVTRMPSGGSVLTVDTLYFASKISLDAYKQVEESFSTRSVFSPQCRHCVIVCTDAGGKAGLVSYTGLAPSFNLNI